MYSSRERIMNDRCAEAAQYEHCQSEDIDWREYNEVIFENLEDEREKILSRIDSRSAR